MRLDGLKIGLIEDDPIVGESLFHALDLEGAEVQWWKTGAEAHAALSQAARDIYICDIRLPDISGDQVFRKASRYRRVAPFLFMTAYGDVEQAVRLLKLGAGDYVTKPFELDDLLNRIVKLVPNRETRRTKGALGPSAAMLDIEQTLKRVAKTRMPVLLTGETGVGKEVCARFLHELSSDDAAPFVALNCAAVPERAIEVELFGREKPDRQIGLAERALSGTLYLDRISELPPALQPMLLRFIEEEAFRRTGGDLPVPFDARIMSSAGPDVRGAVSRGTLREDLFFRVNTVLIDIPTLRERPEDILWLAGMFLRQSAALTGTDPKRLSAGAEERLLSHVWPGNVRELRNRVERANTLARTSHIMPEDLFTKHADQGAGGTRIEKLAAVRDAAEKRHIILALEASGGNVSAAAKTLGVARTTMWEKMLKHDIGHREGG